MKGTRDIIAWDTKPKSPGRANLNTSLTSYQQPIATNHSNYTNIQDNRGRAGDYRR